MAPGRKLADLNLSLQDNICIVLVRPQYLGNLGSSARVMKNFGFSRLRLVCPPRNYKDAEARKMSVGAFDVLKSAEVFSSLQDALKDVAIALGTTSGQQRDFSPLPLKSKVSDLLACAATSTCAIVFGDEVNGLSRDDLLRCHYITTIPTQASFSALNVAQAVAIAVYEVASSIDAAAHEHSAQAFSTGEHDDVILAQLDELLVKTEFSRSYNRTKLLTEFRSFYQRAHPTDRESTLIKGALLKLNIKLQVESVPNGAEEGVP